MKCQEFAQGMKEKYRKFSSRKRSILRLRDEIKLKRLFESRCIPYAIFDENEEWIFIPYNANEMSISWCFSQRFSVNHRWYENSKRYSRNTHIWNNKVVNHDGHVAIRTNMHIRAHYPFRDSGKLRCYLSVGGRMIKSFLM